MVSQRWFDLFGSGPDGEPRQARVAKTCATIDGWWRIPAVSVFEIDLCAGFERLPRLVAAPGAHRMAEQLVARLEPKVVGHSAARRAESRDAAIGLSKFRDRMAMQTVTKHRDSSSAAGTRDRRPCH
jgi:hypothetical protein